jgi:hypothetical protein
MDSCVNVDLAECCNAANARRSMLIEFFSELPHPAMNSLSGCPSNFNS